MESKTLFAKTPPLKLFFIASFPGAVSMLASALYQLLDGMLVGQILGETSFAALNLAMPFVIINFALADLIGVGSSVPIAMNLGKKKDEEANNIFSCACLLIVGTGLAIGAVLFAAAPVLMRLMGAEGVLLAEAVSYMRVYALCSPVTTIVFAMDNYLRICGKIRFSMFLNILMSAMIAGLEFTFLRFLRFGIWGAALATCIGMASCALIALFRFTGGRLQLRFCRPRFSLAMIRRIVSCGSPNFLNNIAGRITSILMNTILLRVGGQSAVSVYGILMYVEGFIQPLLYGMCDSLQPAVSFNWGAGDRKRVAAIERCCFTASAIVSLLSSAAIFFFPGVLAGIFIGHGAPEYFLKQKKVGKIKYFGFSFHGSPEALRRILSRYPWDFVQIQLNYYDWFHGTAREQYEILREQNIPIMVMEPAHGGMLADLPGKGRETLLRLHPEASQASWAFRFLRTLPGIAVILSGMSKLEQVKDNIQTFSEPAALTEQELDIPFLLAAYNEYKTGGEKDLSSWRLARLTALPEEKQPSACIGCGQCTAHCPQGLDVPAYMKEMAELM